jgi:hypothetical protein
MPSPIVPGTLATDWPTKPDDKHPTYSILGGEAWAVIWKCDELGIMRNPLWEMGFEPTAELALEKVERWIEKQPPNEQNRYWNGIFYPVKVSMGVKLAIVKDRPKVESFG